MTTLTVMDYAAIGGLTTAVAGSIALTTGLYLRGLKSDLAARFEAIEGRLEAIEQEKTDRGEWMREMMRTRSRIDEMAQRLSAIDGKLDATMGIGASIRGALSALTERTHG